MIKSNLEDYLEKAPNTYAEAENAEAENAPAQKEAEPAQETKEQKVVDTITVCSPMSGLAADLSTAPDEAFAEKMMGDGAVVTPEDPYAVSYTHLRGVVLKEGQTLKDLYDERSKLYEQYAEITVDESGRDIQGTILALREQIGM